MDTRVINTTRHKGKLLLSCWLVLCCALLVATKQLSNPAAVHDCHTFLFISYWRWAAFSVSCGIGAGAKEYSDMIYVDSDGNVNELIPRALTMQHHQM